MGNYSTSSLVATSNVYPVTRSVLLEDAAFLSVITEPELLRMYVKEARGNYPPSAIQREVARLATPCKYARKGDYPFGTVDVGPGSSKVICLCENTSCSFLSDCNPLHNKCAEADLWDLEEDDDPAEEIDIASFNESFYATICRTSQDADEVAPESLSDTPLISDADFLGSKDAFPGIFDSCLEPLDFEEDDEEEDYCDDDDDDEVLVDTQIVFPDKSDDLYDKCAPMAPTEEQREIIFTRAEERLLVNAGPGTGKTFTLIERIKGLIQDQGVCPEDILVLSFTRAAVGVIERRLEEASLAGELLVPWRGIDVRTLDKFTTWLLYQLQGVELPGLPRHLIRSQKDISRLDYDGRRKLAKQVIRHVPGLFDNVAHVLIDELQDIVGCQADLVEELLSALPEGCGFTLLGDRCQAIFDYEIKDDDRATTSDDLYDFIKSSFNPLLKSLTVNHRQVNELPYDLQPLRAEIMDLNVDAAKQEISLIREIVSEEATPIREIVFSEIEAELSGKNLGILTRTNGEALYVSALLRANSVSNKLYQSGRDVHLTRAIADAFFKYENEYIDADRFAERLILSGFSESDALKIWQTLVHPIRNQNFGANYKVESILASLDHSSSSPLLGINLGGKNQISVSTIHRAKGQEYDAVWVFDENLKKATKPVKGIEECRVAYVALSRPRLQLKVFKFGRGVKLKSLSIDASRKRYFQDNRTSAAERGRRPKATKLELVSDVDVEFASFGESEEVQALLMGAIEEGMPICLEKERRTSEGLFPRYSIAVEDDRGTILLGRTTPFFSESYCLAMRRATGEKRNAGEFIPDCPEAFDSLYVEGVSTCVALAEGAPKCAKRFGDYAIWYGVVITGLASRNTRNY